MCVRAVRSTAVLPPQAKISELLDVIERLNADNGRLRADLAEATATAAARAADVAARDASLAMVQSQVRACAQLGGS